jgi:deoxyribodipyrimidine photolyase
MTAKAHLGATGWLDNRLRRVTAIYLKAEPCECGYLKLSIRLQRQPSMAHFNSQIGEVDLARRFTANYNLAHIMGIGTDNFPAIRGARYLTDKKSHAAVTSRKTR